eukprot:1791939-Alexandrium_andersonii.AAC.1
MTCGAKTHDLLLHALLSRARMIRKIWHSAAKHRDLLQRVLLAHVADEAPGTANEGRPPTLVGPDLVGETAWHDANPPVLHGCGLEDLWPLCSGHPPPAG